VSKSDYQQRPSVSNCNTVAVICYSVSSRDHETNLDHFPGHDSSYHDN
jgi:hypothetical protein